MRRQHSLPVILIGKSNLLREGLAGILRTAHFRILASVSCADDLRQGKSTLQTPLFLIVHTGEDFDPVVEQIELFRSRHPNGRIAVVADHYRLNQLISAFRAGANGYFVNAITCDRFVKSIELVMLGETILPPAFLTFIIDPSTNLGDSARIDQRNGEAERPILLSTEDPTAPLLSPREKVILVCIIAGDSNKCIARKMDIAEATVKVHVKAILRKIRVQNRTQAAIWGINNDLQMHLESASYSLRMADMSKAVANSVEAICEVQPLEPLAPPQGIDAAPLKRLSRK